MTGFMCQCLSTVTRVLRVQGGLGFILGNDGILLRYIPGIMGSDA